MTTTEEPKVRGAFNVWFERMTTTDVYVSIHMRRDGGVSFIEWMKGDGWTLRERSKTCSRITRKTYHGKTLLAVVKQSQYSYRKIK